MKRYISAIAFVLTFLAAVSCNQKEEETGTEVTTTQEQLVRQYVNIFSYNMLNAYYLWNEEISSDLEEWTIDVEPIEKVRAVRYKDSSGKDIDKWTMLTDDYASLSSSVAGTSSTPGFDFVLYYYDSAKTTVCAVITVVYSDSPAAKAGLRRGDCIVKMNGNTMSTDNFAEVIYNNLYGSSPCTLTMHGGAEVKLTSAEMYTDPVVIFKTFDCPGKTVGYLFYNAFTLGSYLRLIEACKYFKEKGVNELILDLRYNGGGYTIIEEALASMLAPEASVKNGDIYGTEVYNKNLSAVLGDGKTSFTTDFAFENDGSRISFSTDGANIGLSKIYALVTSDSASASESLLCCLKPYMDIEIIGRQTYGKYCSGLLFSANDWYEDLKSKISVSEYNNGIKYANNWGIYVMIGRFADKNGNTLCMPDGLVPDIATNDYPLDGYDLGDPSESMLGTALARAGYIASAPASAGTKRSDTGFKSDEALPSSSQMHNPGFGMKIDAHFGQRDSLTGGNHR